MAPGGGVRRFLPPVSGKLSQCGEHSAGGYKTGLLSLTPEGNCARELMYPTNYILVRIFNGRFFSCPAVRAVGRVHAGICCMSRYLLLHVALQQNEIIEGTDKRSNAILYRTRMLIQIDISRSESGLDRLKKNEGGISSDLILRSSLWYLSILQWAIQRHRTVHTTGISSLSIIDFYRV
jgi:hypothetical protein